MRRPDKPLRRRPGTRTEIPRVLVVCEGEKTEAAYFEGVRREFRLSTASITVVGLGADPSYVVERALADASGFDEVWCVFDVEAPKPHARLDETIALATGATGRRANLRCAVSNPCFELWLLLHFQDQHGYLDSDTAQHLLTRCGCGYDTKHKGITFAKVWPTHPDAIRRATELDRRQSADNPRVRDRNPWTSVHELVTSLIGLGRLAHPQPGSDQDSASR